MKGLIIKDLKLLKVQRLFLIIMAGVSLLLLVKGNSQGFVFSYLSAMLSMLVISTISYDEENNGMGFLMTLPASRKTYVMEKYLLGILMLAAVFVYGTAASAVIAAVQQLDFEMAEWGSVLAASMLTSAMIQSVTIPVQLKYGSSGSRVALIAVFVCIVGVSYGIQQIMKAADVDLEAAGNVLQMLSPQAVVAGICVLAVLLMGISYAVSAAVMKRKQF